MEFDVKGQIVKVKRGSFANKDTGEVIPYCHFYVLTQGKTDDNEFGYDYEKFGCKVDFYNSLSKIVKDKKLVTVSCEMIKTQNDSFKRRAIKVDDISLIQ